MWSQSCSRSLQLTESEREESTLSGTKYLRVLNDVGILDVGELFGRRCPNQRDGRQNLQRRLSRYNGITSYRLDKLLSDSRHY